jgi:hypothetical protein
VNAGAAGVCAGDGDGLEMEGDGVLEGAAGDCGLPPQPISDPQSATHTMTRTVVVLSAIFRLCLSQVAVGAGTPQ